MKLAGHIARMGEMRYAYKIVIEKREGKRPLGRPGRRWAVWTGCIWFRIGTSGGLLRTR